MADEVTGRHVATKANHHRRFIQGVVVMALGLLVLAVAAVEYFVFADIAGPAGGGDDLFGLSFGTMAYLAGYTAAGVILIAVGIGKICRAR